MTIRMQDGLMFGALSDPDAAVEHIANMLQTKAAILKYIEPIAQVLAAAGRASGKAMGDSPHFAVDRWLDVIRERAHEILREDAATPAKRIAAK